MKTTFIITLLIISQSLAFTAGTKLKKGLECGLDCKTAPGFVYKTASSPENSTCLANTRSDKKCLKVDDMTLVAMTSAAWTWTSTTDTTCVALKSGDCRCNDNVPVTFTTTGNGLESTKLCTLVKDCVPTAKCVCNQSTSGGAVPVQVTGARATTGTTDANQLCTDKGLCLTASQCWNSTAPLEMGLTKVRDGSKDCQNITSNKCRKAADGTDSTAVVATDGSTEVRTSVSDQTCMAWTTAKKATQCLHADRYPVDRTNILVATHASTDQTCVATGATVCANSDGTKVKVVVSNTTAFARKSATDGLCENLATGGCHTSGIVDLGVKGVNIINGRVGSQKVCVALTGAQCADASTFEAVVANTAGTKARTSITDGTCKTKTATHLVCLNGMSQGNTTAQTDAIMITAGCQVLATGCKGVGALTGTTNPPAAGQNQLYTTPTFGIIAATSASDAACILVAKKTNCRSAAGLTIAIGNKQWTSATDATCSSADLASAECLCPNGNKGTGARDSGATPNTSCTNTDIACNGFDPTLNCKGAADAKVTFATVGTNSWNTVLDATCTSLAVVHDVAIAKCRHATTGLQTAIGSLAWKSATDAECTATLTAAECRCFDGTKVTGTKASSVQTCNAADEWSKCGTNLTLAAGQCRKPIAGQGYKTATDPTCVALLSTECRCPDYTKKVSARTTGTEKCSDLCVAPATTAATAGTSSGGEGEGSKGEGEGGEGGEGGAGGTTGESNSVIFALFAMILAMF